MTPSDIEAASLLRNALTWLEQGHVTLAAHFARKAVRVLVPEDEPRVIKPPSVWSRLRVVKGRG